MPLVLVSRSKKVSDNLLISIMMGLPTIIAANLDVPDCPPARLNPDDVEIQHLESSFDIGHFDVQVTVLAGDYERRTENADARSDQISLELLKFLYPGMTCFCFLFFGKCSFKARTKE